MPFHSQAETWANPSSSRLASPSSYYASRKCPPQDSSRANASRHINSPSSKKSATRPAISRDWLRLSPPKRGHPLRTPDAGPEFRLSLHRARSCCGHFAFVPHDLAQAFVKAVNGLLSVVSSRVLVRLTTSSSALVNSGWSTGGAGSLGTSAR